MSATIDSLVAEARTVLISDPARAAVLLEEVAERLRRQLQPVDRSALAAIATLARNGETFWRAWGRLLGLEPGYTPEGVFAAEPRATHIAVQG